MLCGEGSALYNLYDLDTSQQVSPSNQCCLMQACLPVLTVPVYHHAAVAAQHFLYHLSVVSYLMSGDVTAASVQGTIPAEWGRSGSFPKLKEAGLNGNAYLGGTLPAAWGAQPGSMGNLELLVAQNCQLRGGLPVSWVAQLPALGGLDVTNNDLSGEAVKSGYMSLMAAACGMHMTSSRRERCLSGEWPQQHVIGSPGIADPEQSSASSYSVMQHLMALLSRSLPCAFLQCCVICCPCPSFAAHTGFRPNHCQRSARWACQQELSTSGRVLLIAGPVSVGQSTIAAP